MTERELELLTDETKVKGKSSFILFWTSEYYSFGRLIRQYGFYPKILPLTVYSDHSGPNFNDNPAKHELENSANVFLTHSILKAKRFQELTKKKSFILYSPFVFFRRSNKIAQDFGAKGTTAFPTHTLPSMDESFDIALYVKLLKELPERFQPVRVCLHMHDIAKDLHLEYIKNDIEVVSAGHVKDARFCERFYNILKNSMYTTSNDISTVTFYSIEMGIPFFLYGNKQTYFNISDENVPKGLYLPKRNSLYEELYSSLIFDDFSEEITDKLKNKIEVALGLKHGISRFKMFVILWLSFFYWIISFQWLILAKKIINEKRKRKQ